MNIARTYKRRVSSSSDYAHANAKRYTGNPAAIVKVRRTADYSYDGNPQERYSFYSHFFSKEVSFYFNTN